VCEAPVSFGGWTDLLAPIPLDVVSTLPASLDVYRAITFAFLGSGPTGEGLTAAEQQVLTDWINAGGTALFMTDVSSAGTAFAQSNTILNALLDAMGLGIQVDGVTELSGFYSLALNQSNPLGAGVQPLNCGLATFATVTPPAIAVDATPPAAGKAILAVQALGAGRVVVLSDASCGSDDTNATGTPPDFADCALGPSAAGSLGAFLHNLGGD
jgi:hypothetical protein